MSPCKGIPGAYKAHSLQSIPNNRSTRKWVPFSPCNILWCIARSHKDLGFLLMKYKLLLEQVQKKRKSRGLGEIKWLLHENKRIAEQMEVSLTEEMQAVRGEVNRHVQGSDEAIQTAKCVLFLVLWCIRSWYLFRMLSTELSRLQAGTIAAWQEACNNGWIYCAVETGRPPEGAERETGRGPLGPSLWVTSGAAGGGMAYWGC